MSAQGLGLSIPLSIDSYDGPFALIKTQKDLVRQNVKMVVLTSPGERIGFPDFGVGLRSYLFENANEATTNALKTRIQQQIQKYLPYVNLTDVIVSFGLTEQNVRNSQNRYLGDIEESPNRLNVQIIYYYAGNLNLSDNLFIEVASA